MQDLAKIIASTKPLPKLNCANLFSQLYKWV
jgi:hypothetical protein